MKRNSIRYLYMNKLESIFYANKEYKVEFLATPNWSNTTMSKVGLVYHVTTSNSYAGGKTWLTSPKSGVSCLFLVGQNPGEITQFGFVNQKYWHAGRVSSPNARAKKKLIKNGSGYVNPNLYLDGVEFVGGVDVDKSGKVEKDEIQLTEWQFECAEQIARWHAKECGYELKEDTQLIHQDIASYKPDLSDVLDEITFRLFHRDIKELVSCVALQQEIESQKEQLKEQESKIQMLLSYITNLFNISNK